MEEGESECLDVGSRGGDAIVRQEEGRHHPRGGSEGLDGGDEREGLGERVGEGRLEGEECRGELSRAKAEGADVKAEPWRRLERLDEAFELVERVDADAREQGGARVGEEAAREGEGRVRCEVVKDVGQNLGRQGTEQVPAVQTRTLQATGQGVRTGWERREEERPWLRRRLALLGRGRALHGDSCTLGQGRLALCRR